MFGAPVIPVLVFGAGSLICEMSVSYSMFRCKFGLSSYTSVMDPSIRSSIMLLSRIEKLKYENSPE